MESKRLRVGLLTAATITALVAGAITAPSSVMAAPLTPPTNLLPNDPAAAPTSSTPSTNLIKNVVLTWNPVGGADTYEVQISNSAGSFLTPAVSKTTAFPSFAAPPGLARGDYGWRVRVSGEVWSPTAWFARGYAASPTGAHAVSTRGPVVTWDAVPDASYYEVQLSQLPIIKNAFDTALSENDDPTTKPISCMTTATMFAPGIKVKGADNLKLGDNGTQCTEFFLKDTMTSGTGQWYWRVRARDGVLNTDGYSAGTDAPSSSCTGVWYFRAETKSETDPECSAWAYPTDGDTVTFFERVATAVPAAPTAATISPRSTSAINPAIITNSPVFNWTPTDDNDSFYRIYLSRTADMSTQDYVWETTADHYSPISQLPDRSTRWWWTVQACGVTKPEGGKILDSKDSYCSTPTTPQSFVKQSLNNVSALNETTANGGTTLRWSTLLNATKPYGGLQIASPDAFGYELQISDVYGSFATPRTTLRVDRNGTTSGQSFETLPTADLGNGFRWRVRALDETLNAYPWSNERTVGALQSAIGQVSTAGGFALNAPLDVQFNTAVDGVNASSLRIAAVSNGATIPGSVTQTGPTTFRVSPTGYWAAGESYRLWLTTTVQTVASSVPATASGAAVRAGGTVDSASPALTRVTGDYGWSTAKTSNAIGKSYLISDDRKSTSKRSYVQAQVRGATLNVYACRGKKSGYAGIYVDGSLKKKVSLYKKSNTCGKVAAIALASGSAHTVRFAALGTKQKKATKTKVRFDAFSVS